MMCQTQQPTNTQPLPAAAKAFVHVHARALENIYIPNLEFPLYQESLSCVPSASRPSSLSVLLTKKVHIDPGRSYLHVRDNR